MMGGRNLATAFRVDKTKYIVDGEVKEWRGVDTHGTFEDALFAARKLSEDEVHPVRVVEVSHTEVWRSDE